MSTNQSKVAFLKHQLPAVNSTEYWAFRKANQNLTHNDYTVHTISKSLPSNASRQQIVDAILAKYDTNEVAKLPIAHTDRQVLQYLGQLTNRGWSRLINQITTIISTK